MADHSPSRPGDTPSPPGPGDPTGIDVAGVTGWFADHAPDAKAPLTFTFVEGGRSNLTYVVTDTTSRRWVLRRPPLGQLLASAHDMGREHRIMAALQNSPVPVPPLVGLCPDDTVTGAPFYVMEFVDGLVMRNPAAIEHVDHAVRWAAGESVVDTLVALHTVNPDDVGLGDLGRKEGYVERLIRRWFRQFEQSKTREVPLVAELAERLGRSIPAQQGTAIVHGDYRLDNVISSPVDGTVQAVLDWEICTLGDPLADVGTLLVYWTQPDDEYAALPDAPTAAPGFPMRTDVIARYTEGSGRDLSEIDYYIALGLWKVACILEGVYARYRSGAYGATDDSWQSFETRVPRLAEAAHDAATRVGR